MSKDQEGFEFDVALSFAGEDRPHARALANLLKAHGVRVFDDESQQASLWGKDLPEHLHEVFSKKARYCIMFCSSAYVGKMWTDHERRAALERAMTEKGKEYILPIRLDATEVPGIRRPLGYLDLSLGLPKIADMVLAKLGVARNPIDGSVEHVAPGLSESEEAILAVFKAANVGVDELLRYQEFRRDLSTLAPPVRQNADLVIAGLVKRKYLKRLTAGLQLLKKGADALYGSR